jgi:hypothetical protein
MAVVFLGLFFVLLMFDTRAAFGALAVAIVMLYRNKTSSARRNARPPVTDDI